MHLVCDLAQVGDWRLRDVRPSLRRYHILIDPHRRVPHVLVRRLVERRRRDPAVPLPHLAVGEYDIGTAQEGEVKMFLVVLLGEAVSV